MAFEWDELKNASNKRKHGVGFELVDHFDWKKAVLLPDSRFDYGEDRMRAYGRIDGEPHCFVFVLRAQNVRIISLRRMHDREVKRYGI